MKTDYENHQIGPIAWVIIPLQQMVMSANFYTTRQSPERSVIVVPGWFPVR